MASTKATREQRKPVSSQEIEQRLKELQAPLRDEQRAIDTRLAELTAEADELRATRRRIDKVLRGLDPTSFVAAPKKNTNHRANDDERQQKVLKFIEAHRKNYDQGIISANVYRDMKAAGIEPVMGPSTVKRQIESLHANGVLRADRKVRGGAMLYKFVSNGAGDGEAS